MLNQGSCASRLTRAYLTLTALDRLPETARLFGPEGPDPADTARGWLLHDQAEAAMMDRQLMHAEAMTAVSDCARSFEQARLAQIRLTALARVVISVPSDKDRLGLRGRRAEALGAWLVQAGVFHANLNPRDRQLLAKVGVDEVELLRAKTLLDQLGADHAACVAAKAAAKAATEAKDAAFKALAAYMSGIIAVARALERTHPEVIMSLEMSPDRRRRPSEESAVVTTMPEPSPEAGPEPTAEFPELRASGRADSRSRNAWRKRRRRS